MVGDPGQELWRVSVEPERLDDFEHLLEVRPALFPVAFGNRPAFHLVAVQQRFRGAPLQHRGELPAQVVCVCDSSVHPEAAGRRETMCGVSD